MVELTIEQAKTVIKELYCIGSRDSVLLLGKPGIGKTVGVTECFREVADSLGKEFVVYNDKVLPKIKLNPDKYFVFVDFALTQCEPSDLTGIPRDEDGYIMYKPLGWTIALSLCAGVLFLDEITNVQRLDIQSVFLKLLLEKLCGFIQLNKDVVVVSAGNKTGRLVTTLPEPVLAGRVVKMEIQTPTLEEWINYMNISYNDYDKRVTVFLHKFGNLFAQEHKDDVEDWSVVATPRSWTKLANMSAKLSKRSLLAVAEGLVGRAAVEFQSFINTDVVSIDSLVTNVNKWFTMSTDQKYFAVLELMNKEADEMFGRYREIVDMLVSKDREFLVLTFMLMCSAKRKKVVLKARESFPEVFNMVLKSAITSVHINRGEDSK